MAKVPVDAAHLKSGTSAAPVECTGFTPDEFSRLCRDNPELRLEFTAQKEIVFMSPASSKTGHRNAEIARQVGNWALDNGTGIAFDSNAGFTLPNGAIRAPDASWMRREKWDALSDDQQDSFSPVCPDFVIELRSKADSLRDLHLKMAEYIECGASLGWLIDPVDRAVYVYRPGVPAVSTKEPAVLHGDPELPGFVLSLAEVW